LTVSRGGIERGVFKEVDLLPVADRDDYITDPRRPRSLFSRLLLSPKFMFYPQVFWIVWANGRRARKGKYDGAAWAKSSGDILRALENVGITVEIAGMGNFRNIAGPAVFIANHMSTLETFVLPYIIQPVKELTFIVKKSLLTAPVFGPVMRSRDPVVVCRTNPREDLKTVLEEGTKRLAAVISLVVFPQSTRSPVFIPDEFNTLGIKLALRAGAPIVPVALKTDAWGTGRRVKDFGSIDVKKKVHFAFGAPMQATGRGTEEHKRAVLFIQEKLKQWEDEDKDGHRK
jgi:1-acyl-sn-glycerol-3-phosphate acyltransferase